jgi:hypothetical protein
LISGLLGFLLSPRSAHTLAVIRIATGGMLAYIHVVWMLRLEAFLGPNALLSSEFIRALHAEQWKWTYLAQTDSLAVAWGHELVALLASICMCLGLATRWSTPIAWLTTLLTAHRLAPFLFGLDQIALMVSMYLCLADSGDVWSLDARLRSRSLPAPSWNNTLATRMIQLHLCVIYLFGGLGKLRGWMWWDGSAMWFAAASYEYQSLPLTWIGSMPTLASMVTHVTLFFEFTYAALVWSRWTRPCVLAMAVFVHLGIALFLGMITFGFMMIVANLAFVEPESVRRWCARLGLDRLAQRLLGDRTRLSA